MLQSAFCFEQNDFNESLKHILSKIIFLLYVFNFLEFNT